MLFFHPRDLAGGKGTIINVIDLYIYEKNLSSMGLIGNQVDAAFIGSDGDEHSSCSGAYCAALSRRMVAIKSKEVTS